MKAKYSLLVSLLAAGLAAALPAVDEARLDALISEVNAGNPEVAHMSGAAPADVRKMAESYVRTMDLLHAKALEAGLDKQADIRAEWKNAEARFYAEKYLLHLAAKAEVSEREVRRIYDEQTRIIKIQRIAFETAEKAKEAQDLLLKGLSFDDLVKRFPEQEQIGDFITLNDLPPEIAAAAAVMKRGEVSVEPLAYQQRFYLLKLAADERNPAAPPFAAVKSQLIQEAKQLKAQEEVSKLLEENGIAH